MPKNLIALLADTQLYKELYGLEATRQDWFDALFAAVRAIKSRIDRVSCILILGDVLDKEEVGSRAVYVLLQALKELSLYNIPIGMVLGNHDNLSDAQSSASTDNPAKIAVNWIRVCQQANPNVVELTLTNPLVIPAQGDLDPITIVGCSHRPRAQIMKALAESQPLANPQGEVWLCLHQALKELSAHVSNWEVTVDDVPPWVNRVFLGDFHDNLAYRDRLGREFVYPGSTETVSFNQAKRPGFLFYDRSTKKSEHVSTQQREYLTFELSKTEPAAWEKLVTDRVQQSNAAFHKRPVVRVYYPPAQWEAWSLLEARLAPLCLRVTAQETQDPADLVVEDKSELAVPACREDVKRMAQDLLAVATSDVIAQDCLNVLNSAGNLQAIRERSFPGAVYRPKDDTRDLHPVLQLFHDEQAAKSAKSP